MLDFDRGGVGRGPNDTRRTLLETLLPLPAPKPVDALRQHTRAVVLISADGEASPSLLDAIRDSEIPCELIGHPLLAMAELVRLEKDNRLHAERTALFVADDERIEQLSPLFASVRVRLPQVAIWVIAGEFAVQVQRATVQDPIGSPTMHGSQTSQAPFGSPSPNGLSHPPAASATSPRTRTQGGPVLRIVDHADDEADRPQHRTDHAVEVKSTGSDPHKAHPAHHELDANDASSEPEGGAHSTKLTAEELDMLLGWDEHDASEQGPSGDGGRR